MLLTVGRSKPPLTTSEAALLLKPRFTQELILSTSVVRMYDCNNDEFEAFCNDQMSKRSLPAELLTPANIDNFFQCSISKYAAATASC